jgi:hypothetical protein
VHRLKAKRKERRNISERQHKTSYTWGLCTKGEGGKIDNSGGGEEKELVNSKIPHDPPYISSERRIVG